MENKTNKRNWFKGLLKGMSLTAVAFTFQACYGTPRDIGYDKYVEGTVLNRVDNQPIEGIKITFGGGYQYTTTDAKGNFSMHIPESKLYVLKLEDVDGEINKLFVNREEKLSFANPSQEKIKVTLYMDEKE